MIIRQLSVVGILAVLIGLSLGCGGGQPRVTVITSTMVGIEAKPPMGDAQPNPSVSLGYKRAEIAVIPVCHVPEDSWWITLKEFWGFKDAAVTKENDPKCPSKGSKDIDAYAVLGSFQMAHNWFGPLNIRQFIATGMAARHLVSPTVHVIGEVKSPGHYPFTKGLTSEQVVALAGGRTDDASPDPADVLRHSRGQQEKKPADFKTMIEPDDIVEIPRVRWFHIVGEVKDPGRKRYEEGFTIEKALQKAGGRTETEGKGKIKATQTDKDGKAGETRELGTKAAVLPGDIIVVEPPTQTEDKAETEKSTSNETVQGSKVKGKNTDADMPVEAGYINVPSNGR